MKRIFHGLLVAILILTFTPQNIAVNAAPMVAVKTAKVAAAKTSSASASRLLNVNEGKVSGGVTGKTIAANKAIAAPTLSAASVVLIDAKTGGVLWRKNANQKRHMASTTKIMTAIVALERASLDETITVGSDVVAAGKEGGIKLVAGEKMKMRDLMYALLLSSANDAAVAIADRVAGSQYAFAGMMNRKAAQLGARGTHFVNPHGLDDRLHYSTVGDLALFARHAMKNKTFAQIVAAKSSRMKRVNHKLPTVVENTNILLSTYPGMYGIKTGYTKKAQNCLVSGAVRGDVSLIGVVLGVKNRKELFKESAALLDFGFSLYEKRRLISKNVVYASATTDYNQRVDLVAKEEASAQVRKSVATIVNKTCVDTVKGPVKKGAVLGKINVIQGGRIVASTDLVAKEDIDNPTISQLAGYYWVQFVDAVLG